MFIVADQPVLPSYSVGVAMDYAIRNDALAVRLGVIEVVSLLYQLSVRQLPGLNHPSVLVCDE
jgi:hypothetical protein